MRARRTLVARTFASTRAATRSALVALLCVAAPLSAQIDDAAAGRAFAEAQALSAEDAGALWGLPLYDGLIFLDGRSGTIAANRADPAGALTEQGDVFVGPMPSELIYANTAQDWQGQSWTTVLWPLPGGEHDRARLLAHEMYHRIQPAIAARTGAGMGPEPLAAAPNEHLDQGVARETMRLEWRALAAALRAPDDDARRTAMSDALLFRAVRHALFQTARSAEVALESNEGVAEYTGYRLCGLEGSELRNEVARRVLADERNPIVGRGFAYTSGGPYGLLLDDALEAAGQDSWRDGFRGHIDFGVQLRAVLDLQLPRSLGDAYSERWPVYDPGGAIGASEKQRDADRMARLEDVEARFVRGPVLRLPVSDAPEYSFDPYGVEGVPGRGQFYTTIDLRDAWGRLHVTAGGVLVLTDESGVFTGLVVPWSEDAALVDGSLQSPDGYTLELADGWALTSGERDGDQALVESPVEVPVELPDEG